MRNLKRTLSLVLAAMMLIGMMVVSAGAASKDFTDSSEIQNKEAVEIMVALNVISGKDDGSYFDPTGTLTREEMAKVISYVMNGGVEPVVGTKVTPTYSDIKGIWSEKYIEYCTSMGIINGDGAGKFNPTGTLTAEQAAKMFLTAMGYNANVFGFTGSSWAINVGRYANEAGLYKNLGHVVPSDPISRDDACQMAYNAIQATMMRRTWSQDLQTGELTETYAPWVEGGVAHTLLGEKFNGTIEVGFLTGYNYDVNKKIWTYSFAANTAFGTTISVTNPLTTLSLKSDVDYTGLFGQQVKVIYDSSTNDAVYGIYANESKVLAEGYTGNLPSSIVGTDESVSFAGTTYKLDTTAGTTGVYNSNNATKVNDLRDLNNTSALASIRLIDNDNDTKVDAVVMVPHTVAKVTYVGTSSITVDNGIGSQKLDEIAIYDGVAKDDYVLYTASARSATQVPTFEKLEVATGTITGTKTGNNFLVDGNWLVNTTATTLNVNDTIEYIALGGRIYYAKVTTSGSTGTDVLAMIYNVGIKGNSGVTAGSVEASIIFADGTKSTVTIDKVNGVDVSSSTGTVPGLIGDNIGAAGTAKDGSSIANNSLPNLLVGELITFQVNDNGNYDVWNLTNGAAYAAPTGSDFLSYEGVTAGGSTYTYSTNTIGGRELAEDAVVFVFEGTAHTAAAANKAYVYTGKEIKNTGANYGGAGYTTYGNALYGKVNGFSYVQVAALGASVKPNVVTGTNYGYLVSDAYTTKENNKNYVNYSYWNGTAVVSGKSEGSNVAGFTAGAVITFDDAGDGLMKNVSVPLTLTTGKVTGWDGSKKISLDSLGNYELSDDTVILYVDSNAKTGVQGDIGIITEAADMDNTIAGTENNVRYITSGTKDVALLVVDVNNYMRPAPSMVVSTVANALIALGTNGSVTIDGAVAATNEATLLAATTAGRTLTISGNFTAPASSNLAGNLVVTGVFTSAGFNVQTGASLKVGTLAGANLTAVSGAAIEVLAPNATAMRMLETGAKVAGAKVTLGAAANAIAANTWFTYAGTTTASGTAIAAGSSVPAGIYVCGTAYYSNNGTITPDTAWVLQ